MDAKNFKVGQKWMRRDGEIVTITDITYHDTFPIIDSKGNCKTVRGTEWQEGEDEFDLIGLVEDVAEAAIAVTGVAVAGFPPPVLEQQPVEVAVASIPAPPKVVIPSTETLALLRNQASRFNEYAANAVQELQALVKSRENIDKRIAEVQAEYDKFIKAKDETRAFVDSVAPGLPPEPVEPLL